MPPWEQIVRLPVLWHFGFTDTHELHLMGSNGTSKRRSGPEAVRLTAGLARIPGEHTCAEGQPCMRRSRLWPSKR